MTILHNLKWAECTYCGDSASALDHVTPYSWNSNRKRTNSTYVNQDECVPCCSECNSITNTKVFFDIASKAAFIAGRLARRHRRYLEGGIWLEDDYQTIKGSGWGGEDFKPIEGRLEQSVRARQSIRQMVIERVRHANTIAGLQNLTISDVWKAYERGEQLIKT